MRTASGLSALLRAFHLALTVEGLRPATIGNCVGDIQRFIDILGSGSPRSVTSACGSAWLERT